METGLGIRKGIIYETYLSPKLGMMQTMFLPFISARFATVIAAITAAPLEIPHSIPFKVRRKK